MHSGFTALRTHMPMDIRSELHARGITALQRADVASDVARVQAIWSDCLARSSGPLLFGGFTIADAFYAPVVTRFRTYGVVLPPALAAYAGRVLALPAMQQWVQAARAESEVIQY
jgi:glutathione S-transferase